jgi:hypothetical protein
MGFYNYCVTGKALLKPYQLHEQTYSIAPNFLWQQPWPKPAYHHGVMEQYNTSWSMERYNQQRSLSGLAKGSKQKLINLWRFYKGYPDGLQLVVMIPIVMLPWVLVNRWQRFALFTWGAVMSALFLVPWRAPHYSAPVTGLVCVLLVQGMRHLRLWRWKGKPVGDVMVWTISIIALASFIAAFPREMPVRSSGWGPERARILAQLEQHGSYHLVLVRYGPRHSPLQEWVYNEADIDRAKVVWAREMDTAHNRKLLEYFKDRHAWLLRVEEDRIPPKLAPYAVESELQAMMAKRP